MLDFIDPIGKTLDVVSLPEGTYTGFWMEGYVYIETEKGDKAYRVDNYGERYKVPVRIYVSGLDRAEFWETTS